LKLTLFSLGKVDALAQSLAQRITTRYPPVIANTPEPVVSQERFEEILDAVFSNELERGSRYGLAVRVTLGYALRWKLREIGYDDEFVDFAAKKLGQRLTRPDA
jgi:predicted metal-dependent TIM-barrel fold hydrolase